MQADIARSLYKRHRYPGEIISHCVWLYHRFPLSYLRISEQFDQLFRLNPTTP